MARSSKIKESQLDYKTFFAKPLKHDGEKWFLISVEWLSKLKNYLDGENNFIDQNPGKIDNSSLFFNDEILKQDLVENKDFKIINQEDWNKLVDNYGFVDGTHIISREVVDLNQNKGSQLKPNLIIDLYPITLKMHKFPITGHPYIKSYSKADKINKIQDDMKNYFQEPKDIKSRFWATDNVEDLNSFIPLIKSDQTLYDAGLTHNHFIFMESANKNIPKWGLTAKHPMAKEHNAQFLEYEHSGCENGNVIDKTSQDSLYTSTSYMDTKGFTPGLSGLVNLGNTCFMNSAIQCLSNVPPLTEYFISKRYLPDINANNPLGMKGLIAQSYARLMESLWTGKNSSSNLRSFKEVVSEFAPTFSGYQQHDSQELLTFLLDGLHEDLNRIKKKPYVEIKDIDGRKDHEMSSEAWKLFKMRNDSIVVDTFYGQLKSTLVCPTCQKISITFDPFSTLSVPLPFKKERNLKIRIFFYSPNKKPLQCRVNVPKNGAIADLCLAASNLTEIPTNQLIVVKVTLNRFNKIYNSNESISFISSSDDIIVYEIPISPSDKKYICLPVYQEIEISTESSQDTNTHYQPASFFVPPMIIALPVDKTNEYTVRKALMEKMKTYVIPPAPGSKWWEPLENGNGDQPSEKDNEDTGHPTSSTFSVYLPHQPSQPRPLFSINVGNIFGNIKATLVEDPSAIVPPPDTSNANLTFTTKIEPGSFLILNWDPLAKNKFFDIEAALDLDLHDSMCNNGGKNQNKKCCELTECLDSFVSTERLSEEDSWYCPSCKKHQQATKKFDLWRLPPILVIHLKRFFYTRFFREKITIGVNFPINNLDLSKYVKDPDSKANSVYNLIAVSNHYGEMGYGHYTAFAKNYLTKDWYNFDDTHVLKVQEGDVGGNAVYVLFYQRKGAEKINMSALHGLNPLDDIIPNTTTTNNTNNSSSNTIVTRSTRSHASSNSPPTVINSMQSRSKHSSSSKENDIPKDEVTMDTN